MRLYFFGSLVFIFFIFSYACQTDDRISFRQTKSITGELVPIKSENFNPTSLKVCDSLLVIREKTSGNKAFKIVSLEDFKVIAEYGQFGRGPGEIVNPGPLFYDDIENSIWISDWSKNQFYKLPVDSVLSIDDYMPRTVMDINIGMLPMLNVFFFNDGVLGFSSYNLQRRGAICFLDFSGKLVDSLSVNNSHILGLWTGRDISDNPYLIEYNRNKEEFVVASRHSDEILILNLQGDIIHSTKGNIGRRVSTSKYTVGEYTTYYTVFSDEKYIYAYYVGDYPFYLSSDREVDQINYPNRILVFNWKGEGIYDIEIDHELVYVSFDVQNKLFVGFAEDYAEGLVIYDLSQLEI